MAKLYQHKNDMTYYTRLYRGGLVTRQIHPQGVAILVQHGVSTGDEIPADLVAMLESRGLLFTKDEMAGWGAVNWSSEEISPGTPGNRHAALRTGPQPQPSGSLSNFQTDTAAHLTSRGQAEPKPLLSPEAEWPIGLWIAIVVGFAWLGQANLWMARAGLGMVVAYKLYGGIRQMARILQADPSHVMPWSTRAIELREVPEYQRERKLVVLVLLTIFTIIGFLTQNNDFEWLGALVILPAIWTMFELWRLRSV